MCVKKGFVMSETTKPSIQVYLNLGSGQPSSGQSPRVEFQRKAVSGMISVVGNPVCKSRIMREEDQMANRTSERRVRPLYVESMMVALCFCYLGMAGYVRPQPQAE